MLEQDHRKHLIEEGFSLEQVETLEQKYGVCSLTPEQAGLQGFRVKGQVDPAGGIYFPFNGSFGQLRCDNPPIVGGKPAKYLTPAGLRSKVWRPSPDAHVFTEGFKDAAAGTLIGGIPTGALAGVSHYRKALGKGCNAVILFDADGWANPAVFLNLYKAGKYLNGKIQLIPEIEGEPKAGLCEYFKAGHSQQDYDALIKSAMKPDGFLMKLPSHWNNLEVDKLIECIRVVSNLAVRNLGETQQDALIALVKPVAKGKLSAGAVKAEFDNARDRLNREKSRELKAQQPKGTIPIEFDRHGSPILPCASFVANFLVGRYQNTYRYDLTSESWFNYSNGVWRQQHESVLKAVIRDDLDNCPASDIYSAGYVESIYQLLKNTLALQVRKWPKESKQLIPFENGVLNRQTMELQAHSPDYMLRWQLPYGYDPGATCEPILEWMLEAQQGDSVRVQVLLAYLKAILDGRVDLQRFIECTGPGGSGKGTYTRIAQAMIGLENYYTTSLEHLETNRFEQAAIYGKRLVVIADADKWNGKVEVLKNLTGGDSLRYERKRVQQGSSFTPDAMVVICDNEPFQSTDNTSGLLRRRLSVPFELRVDTESRRDLLTIKDNEREPISGDLAPYLPGLINHLLAIPDSEVTRLVRDTDRNVPTLGEARVRSLLETNSIAAWLDSNIVLDPEARTNVGKLIPVRITEGELGSSRSWEEFENTDTWLYPNYVRFCKQTGAQPVKERRFSGLLKDLLNSQLKLNVTHDQKGRNGSQFLGIAIRSASDDGSPRPISDRLKSSEKPTPSEVVETVITDHPAEAAVDDALVTDSELPESAYTSPLVQDSVLLNRDQTISKYSEWARKLTKEDIDAAASLIREMQPLPLEARRTFWGIAKNLPAGTAIRRAIDRYPELKRVGFQREKKQGFEVRQIAVDKLTPSLLEPDFEFLADPEAESA